MLKVLKVDFYITFFLKKTQKGISRASKITTIYKLLCFNYYVLLNRVNRECVCCGTDFVINVCF